MVDPHVPGNEPDSGDMASDPDAGGDALNPQPVDPGLAGEQVAARLGDFA